MIFSETREMSQQESAFVAVAENLDSMLSTTWWLTSSYHSSFKGADTLF